MSSTTISPEQLAVYRESARARAAARTAALAERQAQAWSVARRASALLRAEYGATRVAVFGSLAVGTWFDERSDVDIAAWGIAYDDLWRASGAVAALDTMFVVDLIRVEEASESLVAAIESESIEL